MSETDHIVFGFPDFAPKVYAKLGPALPLAEAHSHMANDILALMPPNLKLDHVVPYMLVRMVTTGWVELLILVVNGAGLGAMKIARGMFESAVMAEYLRQVPDEITDYIEYGHIVQFRRYKQSPQQVSAELAESIENEYKRTLPRFQHNGRTRNSWNRNSISYMAEKVGRKQQYELPYSMAASIHHGNFEALTLHLAGDGSVLDVESPPSLEWIELALLSGHTYLLQALNTLNDLLNLGSGDRLRSAEKEFESVWRKP